VNIILFSDHTFIPHRAGGRESSINDLANFLNMQGHYVRVLAKKPKESEFSNKIVSFKYTVIEALEPFITLAAINLTEKIDFIISSVDARNFNKFFEYSPSGTCLFLRDDQGHELLDNKEINEYIVIANSVFTAASAEKFISRRIKVFPPLINIENYIVSSKGDKVVFINPVEKKGIEVVLAVAAQLPNIPFLICEGWPLNDAQWSLLVERCQSLPNITLRRRQTDMKVIYKEACILFAPSQWEEAWGRVVTESQASGIPSVVSDAGGLRESCGIGGIVLSKNASINEWSETIKEIYNSKEKQNELAQLALQQTKIYQKKVGNYITELVALNSEPSVTSNFNKLSPFLDTPYKNIRRDIEKSNLRVADKVQIGNKRIEALLSSNKSAEAERLIFLYCCGCDEAVIKFFQETDLHTTKDSDLIFIAANAAKRSKKWDTSLQYWELLILNYPSKITSYWLQSKAECLLALNNLTASLEMWCHLLNSYKVTEHWYEKVCDISSELGLHDILNIYSEKFHADFNGSIESWRCKFNSKILREEYLEAIPILDGIIEKFPNAVTDSDYAKLAGLYLKFKDYKQVNRVVDSATEKLPASFKGIGTLNAYKNTADSPDNFFGLMMKFGRINEELNQRSNNEYIGKLFKDKPKKIICSWPGLMYGNRYMESFRSGFKSLGHYFFPVDMPSNGVVEDAEILFIQFPDVILWRNRKASREELLLSIVKELISLYQWRKNGTKLIWIVHNLYPHDIDEEMRDLWKIFYYFLGQICHEFASMCPSNELIIRENISSLSLKDYRFFYHPQYQLNSHSTAAISEFRKDFGVSSSDVMIGVLGSIGGYKGLDKVVQAFRKLQRSNIRLLIAGKPRNDEAIALLNEGIAGDSRIILIPQHLDDPYFDLIALACNKIIVPNSDYLNSGAIVYSLCAGKQVLALEKPYARDIYNSLSDKDYLCLIDSFESSSEFEKFIYKKLPVDNLNYSIFNIDAMVEILLD
jgi:glycosyltransferase involved in cell wall biosynthesis